MATKAKAKSKPPKKASRGSSSAVKSIRLKAKGRKAVSVSTSRNGSKPTSKTSTRRSSKSTPVASRRTEALPVSARSTPPERARSKHFLNAIQAYEAGLKLMHGEEFEKAIGCFNHVIADYPEEPEIQERAKVLLHACEKKIQEKDRTVLRSADDYYNVGIADLNRRELASAIDHLQHALKLVPKGDHILYALATASALEGNREQALAHLKQAIHYRGENRFLAARDSDFGSLQEDPEFKQLITASEK